jgi:hypothetical protein
LIGLLEAKRNFDLEVRRILTLKKHNTNLLADIAGYYVTTSSEKEKVRFKIDLVRTEKIKSNTANIDLIFISLPYLMVWRKIQNIFEALNNNGFNSRYSAKKPL